MGIVRINELPEGSGSLTSDDMFIFMDDPSGGGTTKKISLTQISSAIGGGGGSGINFQITTVDLHNGGVQNAQVLQFTDTNYQSVITGPVPSSGNNAQRLIIQGSRGQGNGEGGDVYFWGGDSDTNGGDIKIYAGDADGSESGYGGYVNIDGGNGYDQGGHVSISAGNSTLDGGDVDITAGSPSGTLTLATNGGTTSWEFTSNGDLNLPEGKVVNWGQNMDTLGPPIAGGGTDRVRLWDFKGEGSNFNYAIGAEGNHVWFAMDVNNGTGGFKFYSRDNEIFKISDDSKLVFPNGTTMAPGTFDNGTAGNSGISLNCYVGYELNWQGGHLISTQDGGISAATIQCDSPIAFPGSGVSNLTINSSGITFPDGSTQKSIYPTVVQLGSVSGSINTDASLGDIFDLTLAASGTLANPSNGVDGQSLRWRITHNANSLTLNFGNKFKIPSSATSPLPISSTSGSMDLLGATYDQSRDKWDVISFVPGY